MSFYTKLAKQLEEKIPLQLMGRLIIDEDIDDEPWALLKVPQGVLDSVYQYLEREVHEEGMERNFQPAHISVLSGEEVKKLVEDNNFSHDNFPEKGNLFKFTLGDIISLEPEGWEEMEKVWFIRCKSPELENYRKSLGLKPKLKEHEFHITVALKRKE